MKSSDVKSKLVANISFWKETVEFPIGIGELDRDVVDEWFVDSTIPHGFKIVDGFDHIVFDLSGFIKKDVWELGKTCNPQHRWKATVEATIVLRPIQTAIVNSILKKLVEVGGDKSVYSFLGGGFGSYLWIGHNETRRYYNELYDFFVR